MLNLDLANLGAYKPKSIYKLAHFGPQLAPSAFFLLDLSALRIYAYATLCLSNWPNP